MLRIERQPGPREPVGDPRVDDAQSPDRAEQPQRAAARRLDQPAIGTGERGQVAARNVGDDQHLRLARIVERAGDGEMPDPALDMARAGADVGVVPVAAAARSEEHTSELQSLMRTSY